MEQFDTFDHYGESEAHELSNDFAEPLDGHFAPDDPMPVNEFLPDHYSVCAEQPDELTPQEPVFVTDRPPTPTVAPDVPEILGHPEIEWHTHTFGELDDIELRPFTIIEGVPSFRHFDAIEAKVCEMLSSVDTGPDEQSITREPRIASNRIGGNLRPAGYNGGLHQGHALILPFDPKVSIAQSGRARQRLGADTPLEEIQEQFIGINVAYCGLIRSSRNPLGPLRVEATYFSKLGRDEIKDSVGSIMRTVGKPENNDELEKVVQQTRAESALIASIVKSHRLFYAYRNATGMGSHGYGRGHK